MDAIIVMAGKGSRVGANINKVFLKIEDEPIFSYSLKLLENLVDKIVLVIRKEDEHYILPYLNEKIEFVYGGNERYLSVYNGLIRTSSDYVLIHDGARPFVNIDSLKKLINEAFNYDASMLMKYETSTTYYEKNGKLELLDRKNIILASTPQIVNRKLYQAAVELAKKDGFIPTDDFSLLLHLKGDLKYNLIEDNSNFKITTALDYELARLVKKNA